MWNLLYTLFSLTYKAPFNDQNFDKIFKVDNTSNMTIDDPNTLIYLSLKTIA